MKVLVLGATGFIGFPVAQAFVRAGYEVYGQTRSTDKSKLLQSEEIIPVISNPVDDRLWVDAAALVDVVVDCIGGHDVEKMADIIFPAVVSLAKTTRPGGVHPRLTFIHCSGTWVHPDDAVHMTSDRAAVNDVTSMKEIYWRVVHERKILAEPSFDGIVIRASLVYGRSGSLTGMMFSQAGPGKEVVWLGDKGCRWSTIHCDDLADMFVRVAERAPICKGLSFDATDNFSESVDEILQKLCLISGSTGFRFRKPTHWFEEALTRSTVIRPSLARTLTGWQPRKPGFIDGMQVYYDAWKAAGGK